MARQRIALLALLAAGVYADAAAHAAKAALHAKKSKDEASAALDETKRSAASMLFGSKTAGDASADPNAQAFMKAHHVDTSAVDEEAHVSVLGEVKATIDKAAAALGLKSEEPAPPPSMASRAFAAAREGLAGAASPDYTLADRLRAAVSSMTGHEGADWAKLAPAYSSAELADEFAKAAGFKSKSVGDRVADTLETLHLKDKPPAKVAAQAAASSMSGLNQMGADVKRRMSEGAAVLDEATGGGWNRLLSWTHLREPTAVEQARDAYLSALHSMKVALGTESPTAAEKLEASFTSARDAVTGTTTHALDWLRTHKAGAAPEEVIAAGTESWAERAGEAWSDASAKTLGSMLSLRDSLTSALEAAHLKTASAPPTAAERAREQLDSATARLWHVLGYHEPTVAERLGLSRYGPLGSRLGLTGKHSTRGATSATDSVSGAFDQTLKALNLRDRNTAERAHSAFDAAVHRIKVAVGAEEPTVGEKVATALAAARARVSTVSSTLTDALPPVPSGAAMTDAARAQYDAAVGAARAQLDAIRADTDKALKAVGFKEKTTGEKVAASFASALHDLGVSLGVSEPTASEKLKTAIGGRGPGIAGSGSRLDALLKALHLRDKSPLDSARDAFTAALHRVKVMLGAEPPSTAEAVEAALASARARVNTMFSSLYDALPAAPSAGEMTDAARTQYHSALSGARTQLDAIRADTDAALKAIGWRERSTGEKVTAHVSSALHDLGVSLGLAEPTLGDKVSGTVDSMLKKLHLRDRTGLEAARDGYLSALHSLKTAVGAEDATAAERVSALSAEVTTRVRDAVSAALPHLPPPGALADSAAGAQMTETARAVYEETLEKAMEGLLAARAEADGLMKRAAGSKAAAGIKASRDALDTQMQNLWHQLGYSEPSLHARLIHALKRRLGLEAPTMKEQAEAAIDVTGDALMGAAARGRGIFARVRDAVAA